LKQALQDNQAQLRKYEWVETTIVSLKGEEKDRKQECAYYGVDGGAVVRCILATQMSPRRHSRTNASRGVKKAAGMTCIAGSAAVFLLGRIPLGCTFGRRARH
jgi:hypothetical protein